MASEKVNKELDERNSLLIYISTAKITGRATALAASDQNRALLEKALLLASSGKTHAILGKAILQTTSQLESALRRNRLFDVGL